MLAQTSPEIGNWIMVALLIVNGLGGLGGLLAIFATRREVESMESRVSGLEESVSHVRAEMHAMELRLRDSGTARAEGLHERINAVLASTAQLAGQIDHLTQSK